MAMPDFRPRQTALAQKLRRTATDAEKSLWLRLSRRQLGGYKFSRQMPLGPFVCDLMCREAKLVVEVDGGQHGPGRDLARDRLISDEGYRVLRFWNHEVLENVDGVLLTILRAFQGGPPPPPPASGRGV